MKTLSPLVAPEVVLTTYSATSNDKVGIMMIHFAASRKIAMSEISFHI